MSSLFFQILTSDCTKNRYTWKTWWHGHWAYIALFFSRNICLGKHDERVGDHAAHWASCTTIVRTGMMLIFDHRKIMIVLYEILCFGIGETSWKTLELEIIPWIPNGISRNNSFYAFLLIESILISLMIQLGPGLLLVPKC